MRKCPKCSLTLADDSRICRVCGAILDEVDANDFQPPASTQKDNEERASHRPPVATQQDSPDEATTMPDSTTPDWTCSGCGELIEHTFDACWNCGTNLDGTRDSEFLTSSEVPEPAPVAPSLPDADKPPRLCVKCGSQRIIPGVTIGGPGDVNGTLTVVVAGKPDALVFRDWMFGDVFADICGRCGHLELRVANPEDLYEHYRQSRD